MEVENSNVPTYKNGCSLENATIEGKKMKIFGGIERSWMQ